MRGKPIEKKVLSITRNCRFVFHDTILSLKGVKIIKRRWAKEFLEKAVNRNVLVWNIENSSSRYWDKDLDDGSAYIALPGETNFNIQLIRLGYAEPDGTTHSLREKYERVWKTLNWVWCWRCGKRILDREAKEISSGSWKAYYCNKCWKTRKKLTYETREKEEKEKTEGLEILKSIEKWKRARNKKKVVDKLRKKGIRFLMYEGKL